MNKVIIHGHIGKEPEVRFSQDGKAVANFSVAVRNYNNETDWFKCVAFGNRAETINKYFGKGSEICVSGRLQPNNYTMQDGTKVRDCSIVVDEFDFCGKREQREEAPKDDSFMAVPDDVQESLPFI